MIRVINQPPLWSVMGQICEQDSLAWYMNAKENQKHLTELFHPSPSAIHEFCWAWFSQREISADFKHNLHPKADDFFSRKTKREHGNYKHLLESVRPLHV